MPSETDDLMPGDHTRALEIDGRTRTYLIHVPLSYDGAKPVPLVLAFHGGATDAAFMTRFCSLNDKADQACFIAVYPNGTGEFPRLLTWNAGSCCGFARRHQVDDVAFTSAILDDIQNVAAVDSKRVFATGISNGGMMAYRLAAELADRIAAVAPVAGTLCLDAPCPVRPVSVIYFHGTLDEFVPIAGGRGPRSMSQADFLPVDEALRTWIEINGCRREPTITELPNIADNGTMVVRQEYAEGRDGTSVVLYIIHGGGHTWPGRPTRIAMLGPSTLNISANDLLWEFFKKHPMK
jgi:polyhydroxybutyrate depolymerase